MVIAIALLLFGPKRIPEIAGSMGKGIREFKKSINEIGEPYNAGESPEPIRSSSLPDTSNPSPDRGAPKRLLDLPPSQDHSVR